MRYNCDSNHGRTLANAERTAIGAKVAIEWSVLGSQGTVQKIEYILAHSIAPDLERNSDLEKSARAALSHFDRTDTAVAGATQYFRLADLESNGALRMEAVP